MKNHIFSICLLFFSLLNISNVKADEDEGSKVRFSISGHVKDAATGEDLIGATIFVKELNTGTTTNFYGYYSLNLIPGSYTLVFTYIGYLPVEKSFSLEENLTFDLEMASSNQQLDEVVINGKAINENVTGNEMSAVNLDAKTIREIPALMGEVDIIKAIQLLPGVQTIAEGSSGFSVRGGSMDQNLIQLDEATVYNASHLMGFFSVFNNDAIKDVKLYKGDIPAAAGGRLSSLLDVRMKDGNMKKLSGTGGIGTISSRFTLEGPIAKDKASFIVSGRRTYADIFLKLFGNEDVRDNRVYFYDLNAKVNYILDDNNRIFASAYYGNDVFKNPEFKMGWGNTTFTMRWNHLFSKKLFSNFTFIYSDFDYELGVPEGEANSFEWIANLSDLGGKADFNYYLNTNNTVRFGLSTIYHKFTPGTARGLGSEAFFTEYEVENNNALETGIYLSNEQKFGSRFEMKYGIRFSHFTDIGSATIYNYNENFEVIDSTTYDKGERFSPYYGLEPRIGTTFILNELSSVKASYSRTRQYIHLAQNSTAGTPLDIWFPSSPNVKPQIADQFAVGYFRNFMNNSVETSAEVYYKKIENAVDFKDFAELLLNKHFEGELRFGEAWAYGLEILAKYNIKKVNGWVAYTLSRTERRIVGVNDNNIYPASYDKPHDIELVFNYSPSQRISVGATWVYQTGSAVTFPVGKMQVGNKTVPIFSGRNEYRMPDYHRLDLSFTFRSKDKPGRNWSHDWNFSLYNAYGRKNPWVINFKEEPENPNETYAEMTYLFSFVPSITFNFRF
jgi:hypothetical protein